KLTEEIAAERGIAIDMEGFEQEMEKQRTRSRGGTHIEKEIFKSGHDPLDELPQIAPPTEFLGYTQTAADARIVALFKDGERVAFARPGDEVLIVLDRTPFYAE